MFCMNCGTKFEGKFCPNCGTKVGENVEENLQQPRELQMLRNARECLTKLEEYNVKLEWAIAQTAYIDYLIIDTEEKIKKKIDLDNKRQMLKRKEEAGPKKKISLGKAALGYMTLGTSLLFTGIHKTEEEDLDSYDITVGELKKQVEELEMEIGEADVDIEVLKDRISEFKKYPAIYEKQAIEIYREAKEVLASDEWKEIKTVINPSYLDVDSVVSLIEYLTYGRANTWKEACNLLEDERYKATMIDINAAQLSVQQQMVETQNELVNLTVESISLQKEGLKLQLESLELQQEGLELQEQGLELQLESIDLQRQSINIQRQQVIQAYETNDFLGKQLQEMQKIRKDTKKTAKAAKLSAFLNVLDALTVDTVRIKRR